MNEYELQRVIHFLRRTRQPYLSLVPLAEPDASWNIVTHLIESEIARNPVTLSGLVDVSELPYATALRRVHRMIDEGIIVKRCRTVTGKSFTLHPSPDLKARFVAYACQIKCLLAETFGRSMPLEEESDFYFGGMGGCPAGEELAPDDRLRFLLHDDNYFASMRNMWVDFRSNRATRPDIDMLALQELYDRLLSNAKLDLSAYDVVTINLPWLSEFASRGALMPLMDFNDPSLINPDDFQPMVWETGSWRGAQFGVPIYVTIEILAARRDWLDEAGVQPPRTFDEVISTARRFHDPEHERYGVVWNAAPGMPLAHSFMFFLGACGHGVFGRRPDVNKLLVKIDSPAGREVLDYMHRLVEVSPPDVLTMEWKRGLELFMQRRGALCYVWTMRAGRFEYDLQSSVKRKVKYLPHAAGPGGVNLSPMGGFLLAVPTNLPKERARRAFAAIASMASPESMRVHARNGFPIVPRFSVMGDPEVLAGSPLIPFVDGLAKLNLLSTHQRPNVPQYTGIEGILGAVLHSALRRECTDTKALAEAQWAIERLMAQTCADRTGTPDGNI
jgi:multiple sugar transport system substrate-binding protein